MTEEQKQTYALDPANKGWIVGWAVVRNSHWDLAGLFPAEEEVEAARSKLAGTYEVRHGSRKLGSNDFIGS
ncbi:hypothetical protein E1N52_41925 [Paraburkholderia guartelaensis]|uniref:Uncharacterized protein n=1 Tax=Paraburkholderia guartelaensis TaxID=2546446 RepID=A0A4R5L1V6_9BURK|nr:hypothetical protein [Paraburkholderia guartelaensis]TDG02017.1 hypothetical protein E1N52_41925 [Paraburkholderia guartelaensis]